MSATVLPAAESRPSQEAVDAYLARYPQFSAGCAPKGVQMDFGKNGGYGANLGISGRMKAGEVLRFTYGEKAFTVVARKAMNAMQIARVIAAQINQAMHFVSSHPHGDAHKASLYVPAFIKT